MASASCPTPFLPLSPLVGGPALSEDFFATLVAQGVLKPLPSLSFSSSSRTRTQANTPTFPGPHSKRKPLPPTPAGAIPPRRIIVLLDLLDRMDNEVVKEVQRVRESIREARAEIAAFRTQRQAQERRVQKRRAREKRETKGVEDEFWLQV